MLSCPFQQQNNIELSKICRSALFKINPRGLLPFENSLFLSHSDIGSGQRMIQDNQFEYNEHKQTQGLRMAEKTTHNNFKVAVRIRPNLPNDQSKVSYRIQNQHDLCIDFPHQSYGQRNRKFSFDHLFQKTNNEEIFATLVKPNLDILMREDRNVTILTYGITGSGKTHTIFGKQCQGESSKQHGIAVLSFQEILNQIQGANKQMNLQFSYLQIYNEQVHDLLIEQNMNTNKMKPLNVQQDSTGKIYIQDLSKIKIHSISQIQSLIERGNNLRTSSSNNINNLSSRSHAVLQLLCHDVERGMKNVLTIIDLAGSEKVSQTAGNSVTLQKEGSNINRSLLALGNCIKSLENGESHIPYRDSKLTRLLKEDLSGRSQNLMIACVSANFLQIQETLNTLQYASRASNIKVEKKNNQSELDRNEIYECPHCSHRESWKNILPPSLISQKKTSKQKATKGNFHFEIKYNNQFDSFQQQLITSLQSSKLDSLSHLYNQTDRSLLRDQSTDRLRDGEKVLDLIIKDIFTYYQSSIYELVNTHLQLKQAQVDSKVHQYNTLENKIMAKTEDDQILLKASQTMPVLDALICEENQKFNKTQKIKPLCLDSQSKLFSEEERENFMKENQHRYDSNPRNRKKINIVKKIECCTNNKENFSANTTLDNTMLLGTQEKGSMGPTRRMIPDHDQDILDSSHYSYKETIIRKLHSARKRAESMSLKPVKKDRMIEVSCFDAGDESELLI